MLPIMKEQDRPKKHIYGKSDYRLFMEQVARDNPQLRTYKAIKAKTKELWYADAIKRGVRRFI
jgi:hypothetical protein